MLINIWLLFILSIKKILSHRGTCRSQEQRQSCLHLHVHISNTILYFLICSFTDLEKYNLCSDFFNFEIIIMCLSSLLDIDFNDITGIDAEIQISIIFQSSAFLRLFVVLNCQIYMYNVVKWLNMLEDDDYSSFLV